MPAVCICDDLTWPTPAAADCWQIFGREQELYGSDVPADVDQWFGQVLLPRLKNAWSATRLFLIHVNLKFSPQARRVQRHGIALLQHIRLTTALPPEVRQAHVVLYSFEAAEILRGADAANLVIHSPGVTLLRLPEDLGRLQDPSQWSRWAHRPANLDDPGLREFFRLGVEQAVGRLYEHSYRNRAGAAKLILEFAGDVVNDNHPIVAQYRSDELADLTWKRLRFLMPELAPQGRPTPDRSFRDATRNHRFLLIDDEYERGWFFGLYTGLTGNEPPQNVEDQDVLRVLSDCRQALDFINGKVQEKNRLLERWRQACNALCRTARLKSDAEKAQNQAESWLSQQQALYYRAREGHIKKRRQFEDAHGNFEHAKKSFNELLNTLLDAATAPGQDDLTRLLEQNRQTIGNVSKALEAWARAQEELKAAGKALQEAKSEWDKAESAATDARQNLSKATSEHRSAVGEYRRCVQDMQKVFPFDLVFLDLRLEPDSDSRRPPNELSGLEVLKALKEHFPHVPVIVFTASAKALSAEAARRLGADGYWIKGVSSGEDLRQEILKLLRRSWLRPYWTKLLLIREMPRIRCRRYQPASHHFVEEWPDQSDWQRQHAESLLLDAFWLLWDNEGAEQSVPGRLPSWHAAIRNLGIVQEVRWRGLAGQDWQYAPQKEREFRNLRNKVFHAGWQPAPASRDAEEFFRHTVDDILWAPTLELQQFLNP